jgi:hypothetical protein
VTDADPAITNNEDWRTAIPRFGTQATRVTNLEAACRDNPVLCVKKASVTFEYDLAVAGEHNPAMIARAWETTFAGNPTNLNQACIEQLPDTAARALHTWRAICLADNGKRKAVFAQSLAALLDQKNPDGTYTISHEEFAVPTYLREAVTHAMG